MNNYLTQEELFPILRAAVKKEGGIAKYAAKIGISFNLMAEVYRGVRPISDRVAKTLGYRRKVVYLPS